MELGERLTNSGLLFTCCSNIYPLIGIGAVMRGMDQMLFSSLVFWLGLVLVPVCTLLPDLIVTV